MSTSDYDRFVSTPSSVGSNASIDMDIEQIAFGADTQKLAEALKYQHPDYSAQCLKWTKYCDCYDGQNISKYIYTHTREAPEMYAQRVRRGYYYNYVASVVDLFVAYIYHSPIIRNFGNLAGDDLTEIQRNCDRRGTSFGTFMEMLATFGQITGHCGVLVDMPKTPEEGISNEDERKKAAFRPYLTPIQAHQIWDWELDEDCEFEWVKLNVAKPQERDFRTTVDDTTQHFLIWTREDWTLYSLNGDEAKVLESGDNPLGVVPLVIIRNEKMLDHPWFGFSAVRDIADINIAILNWSSLADEETYERCINVLAVEGGGGGQDVQLSHHNVLEFPSGAAHAPFYLSPGSTPLELIGKQMDRAKDEIYRLAKLGGSTGLLGVREATSGIAYAYEFNETNQSLAKKAKFLEQAEMRIFSLIAKWLGIQWDGVITYPNEFGVEDFLLEFQILSEARMQLTSDTAIQELEKRLAVKMFSRESDSFREKVKKEIDAGDPKIPNPQLELPTTPNWTSGADKRVSKKSKTE